MGQTGSKRTWAQGTEWKWTDEQSEERRTEIDAYSKKPTIRILVFGGSQHGKSSFCNGVVSAVENKRNVSHYFPTGSLSEAFTKNFHTKKIGGIHLIDMPGAVNTERITMDSIRKIASGEIPFSAKINELFEVDDQGDQGERYDVGCVVLVMRMDKPIPDEIKKMLDCVMRTAGEGFISYRVVLTHLDVCDSKYCDPKELKDVLDNKKVQEAVERISAETKIPSYLLSVVRNYVKEPEADKLTNYLMLDAFEKIVSTALEQVEKRTN